MAKKIKKVKNEFNSSQLEVINCNEGACCVIAVAGAGKTTSIVHRISRMIKENIASPEQILATTFTNKAAKEMNERLKKLKVDIDKMQVSTFHSVCRKLIWEENPRLGKPLLEIDATGVKAKNLLKFVLGYQNMNWTTANLDDVSGFIAGCKNSLIRPKQVPSTEQYILLKQAYELFESFRKSQGFITFDDLLIDAWELLVNYEDIRDRWQRRFKFVIVDEFQDTNKAQYEIMRIFAAPENNIMVVGDDDQSIYSWRGAVPEYMINFEDHFRAKSIRIEKNYRCPDYIETIANNLIHNNQIRLSKSLKTMKGIEGSFNITQSFDFDEEAFKVLEYVKTLPEFENQNLGQIAILFRTNSQSRAIEDLFTAESIPYELVGGVNFYERKEIKDIISYFYAALNIDHRSDEGFERIINIPFRYIGKKLLGDLAKHRERNRLSYYEGLRDMPGLTNNQQRQFDELISIIDGIINKKDEKPDLLITWLVNRINYADYIKKYEGDAEGDGSRLSNVKEFIRAASKFGSIADYLNHIEKMKSKRKKKKTNSNKILLSSIHRSKGLEWENVIIIGCNELILPHGRNIDPVSIEEERRLAYVGITRTKQRLLLSHVMTATIQGGMRDLAPSRFLKEMNIL